LELRGKVLGLEAALAFREGRFVIGGNVEGGKIVDKELSERPAGILDLASERRRESEVVNVEQQKVLLVIFEMESAVAALTRKDAAALTREDDGSTQEQPSPAGSPRLYEGGYFALPASLVESIVLVQEITYVPGTPDWILGVVNVRGEIESVLDLKAVLGLGRTGLQHESRLLITEHGELRSGLLVGRVIDIAAIPASSISAAPLPQEGGKGAYVRGEADYLGRSVLILDLPEILGRALEGDRV
jgi:purine-binding chemotaxis protein CheW